MFWAFVAWYFFGGGAAGISGSALTQAAVAELSERVEVVVEDPARVKAAQLTLEELRKEVKDFEKTFESTAKAIDSSYRSHTTDRAAIEAVIDQLNRDWERGQERALDLRFELRDQLTREEWATLYSPD